MTLARPLGTGLNFLAEQDGSTDADRLANHQVTIIFAEIIHECTKLAEWSGHGFFVQQTVPRQ